MLRPGPGGGLLDAAQLLLAPPRELPVRLLLLLRSEHLVRVGLGLGLGLGRGLGLGLRVRFRVRVGVRALLELRHVEVAHTDVTHDAARLGGGERLVRVKGRGRGKGR